MACFAELTYQVLNTALSETADKCVGVQGYQVVQVGVQTRVVNVQQRGNAPGNIRDRAADKRT